jgi:3-methylfumaryl-CoA hydratase
MDLGQLQQWVGRTETRDDEITAAPLRAFNATLDRDDTTAQPGTEVPPLAHWLYFLPVHRQSEIGPDGHAKRGGFLPPVPLPRRMWAGGRLVWNPSNPLRVGDAARRISRIASVSHKSGRSGDLVFVTVTHEVRNAQGVALAEEHDIVYRGAPQPGEAPAAVAAPPDAQWQRELVPDDVLLFRYSALTFNGHRIHYDRRYVTEVEGYPGLIVHGPLIATLLVDLVRRELPHARISGFDFKAVRPTFDGNPMRVCGKREGDSVSLWAQDHEGWLAMKASAKIEA